MPLTVGDLLGDTGLGLTLLNPSTPTTDEVLWAHTSELSDPTPWLAGGELIMTLGLGLPSDPKGQDDYVRRLAARGVVALAVDVGIVLDTVPTALVQAGEEHGIPILAIPARTPFIVISRAVVAALVQDDLDALRTVAAQQERVAAAALRTGTGGVVDALAAILPADVALYRQDGSADHGSGFDLARLRQRVLDRLVVDGRLRKIAGLVHVYGDGVLTVQAVAGEGGEPLTLALWSRQAFTAHERLVVAHAVTLLSLLARTPARIATVEEHLRRAVARLLLVEDGRCGPAVLRALGFAAGEGVVLAFVADGGSGASTATAAVDALAEALGGPVLRTRLPDGEALVAPAASGLDRLTARGAGSHIGLGRAADLNAATVALHQARSAARIAHLQNRSFVDYAELAPTDVLLLSQPDEVSRALVDSLLGPLLDHDARHDTRLAETLEAFLATAGRADAAARALRIHRHTLTQRLERAEKVLGRDLAGAAVRAELWLALRALSLLQRAEAPRTVPVTPDRPAGRVR